MISPILPLETYRGIMGFDPYHFWGLGHPTLWPVRSNCDAILQEYAWQRSDAQSRDQMRRAIAEAEETAFRFLRFYPAPRYTEKTIYKPDCMRHLFLEDGYIEAIGVARYAHIATVQTADTSLQFVDENNDGLLDTFIATLNVPADFDVSDVGLYFTAADRLNNDDIGERWRIQPVSVDLAGTTLTIRGAYWLLVRPILYEGVNRNVNGIDPTNTANMAAALDIVRRITHAGDTFEDAQAIIEWQSDPCHGWWCCCASCSPNARDASYRSRALARVGIFDATNGIVSAIQSVYDPTTQTWRNDCHACFACQPDSITIRYKAGFPLRNDSYDYELSLVVARLASALTSRPICGCEDTTAEHYRWQRDLTLAVNGQQAYNTHDPEIWNPLGTRQGQVFAWKYFRSKAQVRGFSM